jgi:alpha-mannosidase
MARITGSTEIQWLVLGSFPLADITPGKWLETGLETQALFAPRLGASHLGRKWVSAAGRRVNFLSRDYAFKERQWCHAYAFTYVYSPQRQKAQLLVGSDDGAAAWLNGLVVLWNDCQRGANPGQDVVNITLQEGWNGLLFKVSQASGAWELDAHVEGKGLLFSNHATIGEAAAAIVGPGVGARLCRSPKFTLTAAGGELGLELELTLLNDAKARAGRIALTVADAAGAVLGSANVAALAPSATKSIAIRLSGARVMEALAAGRDVTIRISSGHRECVLPLDSHVGDMLFMGVMTGFVLPAQAGSFSVPAFLRGQAAVLEVESAREKSLPREVEYPARPRRDISAAETATGAVRLDLAAIPGTVNPMFRLTFGDADVQALVRRTRFLVDEAADAPGAAEQVRQGLAAIARGDFAAARAALEGFKAALERTQPNRKSQQVTLVGHAHIDMNWLWTSAETIQVCHDTFRQVLSFMDELPDFTFSQSQSSTYRYIEQIDPAMFERIRRRVAQGRWEILGGAVTEGDTNLCSGEGIARTMLYGQRYFQPHFGKTARVGWLPDNFGHAAQLPQLLKLSGIDYFYGHRCQPKLGLYVWEGIDGSRLLNYATRTYNGDVTAQLRFQPAEHDPKRGRLMWIYGVGDHGGGPTRRDIANAQAFDKLPEFPTIRFGSAEGYFASVAPDAAEYPVFTGERQFAFEGCYTSIARVKEGNRQGENLLQSAETLAALMRPYGMAYPAADIYDAWYTLAYNQFHDILCGSAINESNRESVGAYDVARAKAQAVQYAGLRYLAARVPAEAGRGQPLVVFNALGAARTDVVEAEVFSHVNPPSARLRGWDFASPHPSLTSWGKPVEPLDVGQGPYATVALTDAAGAALDAQVIDGKLFPNGYRLKVRFLAKDVPACGHRLYYVRPETPAKPRAETLTVKGTAIETPLLSVKVDPKTGLLTRLYDKRRKVDVLAKGKPANLLKVYMEEPHPMSAWNIGPISKTHELTKADAVRVIEAGPVRAVIEVWRTWGRSTFIQRIIVHRDLPRVDFELDARWFELGGPDHDAPMLRVAFPLNVKGGKFFCDTPFAAVQRPTDGREVPAQKWTDLSGPSGGAALLNDSKYGHRCDGNTLEMTLLRSGYDPDPYPDLGMHLIRYSLLPHKGNWQAGGAAQAGAGFNVPLLAVETPPAQGGDLPSGTGLLSVGPENLILSAVKKAEDGDACVVRFHEAYGKATNAVVKLPRPARAVTRVNLLEQALPAAAPATVNAGGTEITLAVKPHEVVTLRVEFV